MSTGTLNFEFSQQDINKLASALKEPLIDALLERLIPVLTNAAVQHENDMLSAKEVQALLGIKRTTLYKWLNEGRIKGGIQIGKCWRFKRSEIESLLNGKEQQKQ